MRGWVDIGMGSDDGGTYASGSHGFVDAMACMRQYSLLWPLAYRSGAFNVSVALTRVACTGFARRTFLNTSRDACTPGGRAQAQLAPRDKNQSTPLHVAASRGHIEAMKVLAEWGASLELRDADGRTPIQIGQVAEIGVVG